MDVKVDRVIEVGKHLVRISMTFVTVARLHGSPCAQEGNPRRGFRESIVLSTSMGSSSDGADYEGGSFRLYAKTVILTPICLV